MIINELITKLTFKLDPRQMQAYEDRLRRGTNIGNSFGKTMFDAFLKAKKGSDEAAKGADVYRDKLGRLRDAQGRFVAESNRGFGKMGGAFGSLGGQLKILTTGFVGLASASKAVHFVGTAASEYETSITQLTTLVGKDKAGGIFKDLQKFAATTPYELKDIMEMFTRLEGAGFGLLDKGGKVKYDVLIKLGDLASASNQPLSMLTETMLSANRGLGMMVDNFVGLSAKAEDGALKMNMFDRATGKITSKSVEASDKKNLLDFFVKAGERKGVSGGMDVLAKTLSGQMSTLKDNAKAAGQEFFLGFGPHVHKFLSQMITLVGKLTPNAKQAGEVVGKFLGKLPGYLKAAKPYIEPVAIGLGMIATHMIAMKGIAIAGGVFKFLGLLTSIGGGAIGLLTGAFTAISGFITFASGAGLAGTLGAIGTTLGGLVTAALPILGSLLTGGVIVGAIALVVALGVKLADYWARGDAALVGLREKFPGLADGIKVIGDEMAAWWPIIQNVLIGGFNLLWPVIKWCFEGVLVPALGIGLKWLGMLMKVIRVIATVALPPLITAINGIGTAFQFIWDTFIGPILGLIGGGIKDVTNLAGGLIDSLANAAGINVGGGGGAGGAGLASTAINFVKSGQADKYAFSLAKANGFVTKSLFQQGIACAQTTDQLLKMAGASKAVQDAMTASAPGSYAALKGRGLASSVSEKDLKPGDLVFYNPGGKGIQHVGVYVGDGMVVDASNSAGKQIGTGQRVVMRKNWMAGNAQYLRINDNQWMMPATGGGMGGGGGGVVNNISVDARGSGNPELIKTKTKNGVTEALNKAKGLGNGATSPKRGGVAIAQ